MSNMKNATSSVSIAAKWLKKSLKQQQLSDRSKHQKISRIADDQNYRLLLIHLFDQAFRSENPRRLVKQFNYITKKFSPVELLSFKENIILLCTKIISWVAPFIGIGIIKKIIWKITDKILFKTNVTSVNKKIKKIKAENVTHSINNIGEVVRGIDEAKKNLTKYYFLIKEPNVKSVTIKVSNIYPYLESSNFEMAEKEVTALLEKIFYQAKKILLPYPDGSLASKLIMIDMEDHDHLQLIKKCFINALNNPDFNSIYAGIALQSYLPESFAIQAEITEWAQNRALKYHTHPLKIRLVKGANLEYEKIYSELNGWDCPTFSSKVDVDAQYKKMIHFAFESNNLDFIHLGVATHNLFDITYAHHLMELNNIKHQVSFEFLEGISVPLRNILSSFNHQVYSYLPVVNKKSFIHSLGYLCRRLDEHVGKDHFLKYYLNLSEDSADWERLKKQFYDSIEKIEQISSQPMNNQNRNLKTKDDNDMLKNFKNTPTTKWSIEKNQEWSKNIKKTFDQIHHKNIEKYFLELPVDIKANGRSIKHFYDCSSILPNKLYTCECISDHEMMGIIKYISEDVTWQETTFRLRSGIFKRAATIIQEKRGHLIAMLSAQIGKSYNEADKEVSEAIDFINYYAYSFNKLKSESKLGYTSKGTGLVITPWNFPLAIACSGIAASLIGGNKVLFKPAPEVIPISYELANIFWEAGIPKSALGFVPTEDSIALDALVSHPKVDYIIFTGSTETAKHISMVNPAVPLYGETGGKNTMIVTAMADRDQAIKHIIESTFGFAGQKCSATSLLILEHEVYHDSEFREKLCDAIKSIRVGTSWDLSNLYSMRVHKSSELIRHVLSPKGNPETYLIYSKKSHTNRSFLKPTLLWNVTKDSMIYKHELFAPILGVMCAKNLKDAVKIANKTEYGLTAGLQSLDSREHDYWTENIEAGNLYINKPTTGALVGRQPFGGFKLSSFGPSIKTGGENYVTQFLKFDASYLANDITLPYEHPFLNLIKVLKDNMKKDEANSDILWKHLYHSSKSYVYYYLKKYSSSSITQELAGEKNSLRYLPIGNILIQIQESDNIIPIFQMIIAALICKNKVYVNFNNESKLKEIQTMNSPVLKNILDKCTVSTLNIESNFELINKIDMVRLIDITLANAKCLDLLARKKVYVQNGLPLYEGSIELLKYLKEQTISKTTHRFGSIIWD